MNKELFIKLLEAGCLINLVTRYGELFYLINVPIKNTFGTSYVTFEVEDLNPLYFSFKETVEAFVGETPKGMVAKAIQFLQSFLDETYTFY